MTGDRVRLTVDRGVCIGVGQCELLEPDVFRLDDDDELAVIIGDGTLPRERADVVVDKCPSGAIAIQEAPSGPDQEMPT